jgi:amidophosphoribosyltransferase
VGRTFIQPSDTIRQLGIRLKLNPLKSVVAGKRLVVIDDSIVRGNTQRALIRMLREAGAAEIHVRISSPPIKWPCFYGIDFASRAELIANGLGVEEIRASLGADSLGYISEDGMIAATQQERAELCTACFSGTYPTRLPDADKLGKNVFEARGPVDVSPRRAADEPPVARRPEHASAVSIDTHPSADDGFSRHATEHATVSDEDSGVAASCVGCDPGPDSDLEDLLLPEDKVPADAPDQHQTAKDA